MENTSLPSRRFGAGVRKYTIPQPMTVEYFLGDHLGSTSITTDSNGAKVSEMRYTAWGEVRYSWTSGQSTTPAYSLPEYTYTGQFSNMEDFGLMFYNARWYDPYLNHFTQPDSIIPQAQGVQAWDRYAYSNNNPVRFNDPSGHMLDSGGGTSCNDKIEKCSITYTILVGAHNDIPPYVPGANDSTCYDCPSEGQFKTPAKYSIPDLANELATAIRDYESRNGKPAIFTFFTYDESSDGTINAESLTIFNKSNRDISVQIVQFNAKPEVCQDSSCMNMTLGTQTYGVNHPVYNTPTASPPGLGVIPERSFSTISLTPSGYPGNQTNTWTQSYDVTLVVMLSSFNTSEYYRPIIYNLP
jgi:RHS repeat-associated protein